MMKRHGVWVRRLIILAAFAGLFWLLHEIGWGRIALHFNRVGWAGAFALLAAGLVEGALDARALQEASLGRIGFWRVLFLNQAGATVNSVAPGDAGELLKASLISKDLPGSGISTVLIWNIVLKLSKPLVIILTSAIAFFSLPTQQPWALLIIAIAATGLGIYIFMSVAFHHGGISKLASLLARLPFPSEERRNRFLSHVQKIEGETAAVWRQHPRRYLGILVCQIAARMVGFLTVWLGLKLLGSGFPVSLCALIYAGSEIVGYLLPFLPTRIGTTEGSAYLLFAAFGLDGNLGVILQVLMRIKQIGVAAASLAGYFLARFLSRSEERSYEARI